MKNNKVYKAKRILKSKCRVCENAIFEGQSYTKHSWTDAAGNLIREVQHTRCCAVVRWPTSEGIQKNENRN